MSRRGVGGGGEDTRTFTKTANNKGWKHERRNISEGKKKRKRKRLFRLGLCTENKTSFISLCAFLPQNINTRVHHKASGGKATQVEL